MFTPYTPFTPSTSLNSLTTLPRPPPVCQPRSGPQDPHPQPSAHSRYPQIYRPFPGVWPQLDSLPLVILTEPYGGKRWLACSKLGRFTPGGIASRTTDRERGSSILIILVIKTVCVLANMSFLHPRLPAARCPLSATPFAP